MQAILPASSVAALRHDIGVPRVKTLIVDEKRGTGVFTDPVDVYATPMMIFDMEIHVHDLIGMHTPDGFDSLGMHVDFNHTNGTPIGSEVTLETTIKQARDALMHPPRRAALAARPPSCCAPRRRAARYPCTQVQEKTRHVAIEAECVIRDKVGELGRGLHRRAVLRTEDIKARVAKRMGQLQELEEPEPDISMA